MELLGSSNLSVRLGGIYALARLARDHPKDYHLQVMDVLSAFARHPVDDPALHRPATHGAMRHKHVAPMLDDVSPSQGVNDMARPDVVEIVRVIGRRSHQQLETEREGHYRINLRDTYLFYAHLRHTMLAGVDFTLAILAGANLIGAQLTDASLNRANLNAALLIDADLTHADLTGAMLKEATLGRAILARAKLIGIDLTEATLTHKNFNRADLGAADFANVKELTQEQLADAAQNPSAYPPRNLPDGITWDEQVAKQRWVFYPDR